MPQFLLQSSSAYGGPPPDLRSKSLILVKIWCLIIVFNVSFMAGISPYLMKWNDGFVLLGTQFAGGIFLGTALMQFLSDSDEYFRKLSSKDYPFAPMLVSSGYLLTMLADCICIHVYRKRRSSDSGGVQQSKTSSSIGTSQSQIQIVDDGLDHYMDPSFFTTSSFIDSILLIMVLSFHSVYEGIAIGVAPRRSRAWRVLWIVSLHKVFAANAMGIALLQMIPDHPLLSCAAYSFVFAITTPIGVVIGIVIDATMQGIVADWIYAISMGLSSASFFTSQLII